MPSYQDIETRLGQLERKIDFLFQLMTFTKQSKTGVLDEHGREQVKIEQISMADLYREVITSGADLKTVDA